MGFHKIKLIDLGQIEYKTAWDLQTAKHQELISYKRSEQREQKRPQHSLILCEHPHVYTLGKSGSDANLLIPQQNLSQIGAEFHKINRGGDITYHGPGQLVVYPILDLDELFTDVHRYVRTLEEVVIKTCEEFDIQAGRIADYTGVWLDTETAFPRKICAIGVHISRWVTLHGLAFNIDTDLSYFSHIIPCGISKDEKTVSSLSKELGRKVSLEEVKPIFIRHFLELFELEMIDN